MKQFPQHLRPENIDKLVDYHFKRQLSYVRIHVYDTMINGLSNQESKHFSINLQDVPTGELSRLHKIDEQVATQIRSELNDLGWATSMGYGGTMLFVYPEGSKQPSESITCHSFE